MTAAEATDESWLAELRRHVEARPCVLLRLNESDSAQLAESRGGFNEFTLARAHALLGAIHPPTVCLVFNEKPDLLRRAREQPHAHVGIISSRSAITTLETRIKVKRAVRCTPATVQELIALLAGPHASQLNKRLEGSPPVAVLSPKLSSALIATLAAIPANRSPLRTVAESLHAPKRFNGVAALQEDAVQTALRAFGLGSGDRADRVELVEERSTALARLPVAEDSFTDDAADDPAIPRSRRVPLIEDAVIEHDARTLPGYTLTSSQLTGRAVFSRFGETLQVITANRRDLEHVFGVDLIYLNMTRRNIVMVQYKMLEPSRSQGEPADWIYRPDAGLAQQIGKMKLFAQQHAPGRLEYRFNPQVFFLKFVKRDAVLTNGSIITPLDHYEQLLSDPACRGERNGLRISYRTLQGRYLRPGTFVDLIRSGYIGAFAQTTDLLAALIQSVLDGDRAVVAAVQSATS